MCSYQSIHEWQTRLVLIKPNANSSASLELNLVVVDLVDLNTGAVINHDTIVAYDALSYAWGDTSPSIECICDGNTILLRDNLNSALKHLRQPENERYIWVDFLCINQDDLAEKAVQIPRMKNIYSKAGTVVIWLGESVEIKSIKRHCEQHCGPNLNSLDCSIHKDQLWKPILEYAWLRRTWVRQEVWAARGLEVSCPYFSTTWELFTDRLLSMYRPSTASNAEAIRNLVSLNELYSSRRLELLALLRQGNGFQASIPHDHIFSVLGMMSMPKHGTKASIPVSYEKTYHEVCGDVTRYIIRETYSISILRLCIGQRDRTYAFDWPTVQWLYQVPDLMQRQLLSFCDVTSESMEEFEKQNPIRKSVTSDELGNTASSSIPNQLATRPLILYGKARGTVTGKRENILIEKKFLQAYLIDLGTSLEQEMIATQHVADHSQSPHLSTTPTGTFSRMKSFSRRHLVDRTTDEDGNEGTDENADEYREFTLFSRGSKTTFFESKIKVRNIIRYWECRGCIAKGDVLVTLEPGPWNMLLRRCSGLSDLFEIVGWGGRTRMQRDLGFGNRRDSPWITGPRQQFKIR